MVRRLCHAPSGLRFSPRRAAACVRNGAGGGRCGPLLGEIDDPRGLAADITNLGLWGNGDVQVEIDNPRQIA